MQDTQKIKTSNVQPAESWHHRSDSLWFQQHAGAPHHVGFMENSNFAQHAVPEHGHIYG
jgi:hypothetical protein